MLKIRDLGINAMSSGAEPCVPTNCIAGNCLDLSQVTCDQTQIPGGKKDKDKDKDRDKRRTGAFNAAAIAQLKQQLRHQLGNRAY